MYLWLLKKSIFVLSFLFKQKIPKQFSNANNDASYEHYFLIIDHLKNVKMFFLSQNKKTKNQVSVETEMQPAELFYRYDRWLWLWEYFRGLGLHSISDHFQPSRLNFIQMQKQKKKRIMDGGTNGRTDWWTNNKKCESFSINDRIHNKIS